MTDVGRIMTMQIGPDRILVNLDVRFRPQLNGQEIAAAVDRLESAIRETESRVREIFIEATSIAAAGRRAGTSPSSG